MCRPYKLYMYQVIMIYLCSENKSEKIYFKFTIFRNLNNPIVCNTLTDRQNMIQKYRHLTYGAVNHCCQSIRVTFPLSVGNLKGLEFTNILHYISRNIMSKF